MASEDGEGGGGGSDETPTVSPTGRVKFFCSYGGEILARSSDGVLKYVGGETRVIAVSREITISELMKKITSLFEGDSVLKYQIASGELDALVSVKSEEDLLHMFAEHDRLKSKGNSKLRTFLFPSKPTIIETSQNPLSVTAAWSLEQRFFDAINGVVRTSKPTSSTSRPKSVSSSPSESVSPRSLSPASIEHSSFINTKTTFVNGLQGGFSRMHKVHSSPSICNIGSHKNFNTQLSNNPFHQNSHQQHQHYHVGYQSPFQPQHLQAHPLQMTRAESNKVVMSHGHISPLNAGYNYPLEKGYPGSGGLRKWGHLGDYAAAATATYWGHKLVRADSLPRSPRAPSDNIA